MSIAAIKHSNCPTCRCAEPLSSLDETQVEEPKPHTFGSAREITPEEREFREKAFKELSAEFDRELKISQLQATNKELLSSLERLSLATNPFVHHGGGEVDRARLSAQKAITSAKQNQ